MSSKLFKIVFSMWLYFVSLGFFIESVAWAASIFKPMTFGKRVMVTTKTTTDAGVKTNTEPKWDGNFRFMTIAVDSTGKFNITSPICPEVDKTNPDSAGVVEGNCLSGILEDEDLSPEMSSAVAATYKRIVLKYKMKSAD